MNYNSFFFTIGNIYNNSFYTFLLVLFAFIGYVEISADIALAISITVLFTQIFSGNMRNIIIASNNFNLLNKVKQFRIFLSIVIFFISCLLFFIITNEINFFIFSLIMLIIVGWINELNLLEQELSNKNKKILLYLVFNFLLSILIIFILIIGNPKSIFIPIIFQFIFNFFLFAKKNDFLLNDINSFKNRIYELKQFSFAFYSSFSMIFANFISRSLIFLSVEKNFAGILFASYAIGSLPGTIFNNTFGPLLIKKKLTIPKFIKYLIILIFLFFLFLFLLIIFFFNLEPDSLSNSKTLYLCSLISFLGSYFMVYSLYLRQKSLQNYFNNQKLIFTYDIILNLFLIALTLVIILINVKFFYYFLFLLFSIISILIYKLMSFNLKNE